MVNNIVDNVVDSVVNNIVNEDSYIVLINLLYWSLRRFRKIFGMLLIFGGFFAKLSLLKKKVDFPLFSVYKVKESCRFNSLYALIFFSLKRKKL